MSGLLSRHILDSTVICLLSLCLCVKGWTHGDNCPSSKWNVMCRPCCEYQLIECRCPSKGSRVGYTVPCCRNAVDQCDPCIYHPGCSLFENCKTCHNGTWKENDDFFVNGKYCRACRQGWSGGDCRASPFVHCFIWKSFLSEAERSHLILVSAEDISWSAWRHTYKACGGVIQPAEGHIALESYPTNARCEWTVQAGRGSSVELRFSLLSLEADHSCRHDYVEVRDGSDSSSPVIGRYCGDQLPPPIKSSGKALHILFSSDGYHNFDGFVVTFQERSVPTMQTTACELPERPANGYLEPVHGPEKELVFVNYQCYPPFILTGIQQRTCLPNGTWSGTIPSCVKDQTSPVQCAPPPKLLHGYHRPAGNRQMVEFFCKNSYILSGNQRSTCLPNGSWSSRPPKCLRACREPKVSELVRQSVVKAPPLPRYSMHDVLSAGFLPLSLDKEDRPDTPFPPGVHPVHTSIQYKCASSLYRHTGSSRRTCLKTSRWSGQHVSCSPVCGRLQLPAAQWPWHVAVYIRSAPDGSRGSSTSQQRSALGQQGASPWYLACSGALVAQRRVLVAAHCVAEPGGQQPLHPAQVKVVTGKQYQASRNHHLRVSDVVIHPNFNWDSDVAVLKLQDKAKISRFVLPVCLPRVQGGEVTAAEAYTSRWTLPDAHHDLSRDTPPSQTRPVQLTDVAQCQGEFPHSGRLSDDTLCAASEPAGIPGITALPDPSGWQLLGLESSIHTHDHTVLTRIGNFLDWIKENMK